MFRKLVALLRRRTSGRTRSRFVWILEGYRTRKETPKKNQAKAKDIDHLLPVTEVLKTPAFFLPVPVPFNRPKDFNLDEHLSQSFGVFSGTGQVHVKVRFSPSVSRYVTESQWHGSQRLTPQKDGSLMAEFDLDHTEEIKRWLLSFGRYATVLEPTSLRQDLTEELANMLENYTHSEESMTER